LDSKINSTIILFNNNNTDEMMNPLHFQVKKLQKLLADEQDKFTQLQKRLHESENQRLELISQNNKEAFSLNTQFSKVRNELEKSEATRQNLEYELSLMKSNFNKDKQAYIDKEKMLDEINKNFEGLNLNLIYL
jgi:chromosome segregation ATPase